MKKQVIFAAILAALLLASVVFAVARPKDENSESSTEAETTETETTPTDTQPASGETSAETTGTSAIEDADRIYRGFLMDCNYTILMENQDTMRCITEKYKTSLGNVLDSYHSQSISLDKSFEKVLRIKNEKTFRSDNGHLMGESVVLTLDAELQNNIYTYLEQNNIVGSVTILDADGKVRTLVSYPSYNANADYSEMNLSPDATYNACVSPACPGSTFKMLSAVVGAANGFTEFDDPGYLEALDISNWDCNRKAYDKPIHRTLREAFRVSSNCFFAEMFYELGADKVSDALDKYFCYSQPIACDFVTLGNSIKLDSNADLSRAGFGQRNSISPLYIAMCANEIVTGQMTVPYVGEKVVDTRTLEDIQALANPQTLCTIPSELTEAVKGGMSDVAADLKLTVPEGIQLYCKTGTAEISDDDSKNDLHYIVATCTDAEFSVEKTKTVVFQYANSPNQYASGDAKHVQAILNMLYQ